MRDIGGWDVEGVALGIAKQMHRDGYSHGDISRALAKKGFDVSRSAVIGKMNREKAKDKKFKAESPKGENHKANHPKPPKIPKLETVIPVIKASKPLPRPGAEREIQYVGPIDTTPAWGLCQFTRDDVSKPGWQMCGHPAEVKGEGRNRAQTPWCEAHGRICHQPPHKKQDAA